MNKYCSDEGTKTSDMCFLFSLLICLFQREKNDRFIFNGLNMAKMKN
jgi:hypothetical protein